MLNRIIVAVDGMPFEQARDLVFALSGKPGLWGFKVNDALRERGYELIPWLKNHGRVMADLKLHDIPNTVGNDVTRLFALQPELVTVHASGGVEMMKAAVKCGGDHTKIVAVTVLTSLNEEQCRHIYGGTVAEVVQRFSTDALEAAVEYSVSSGQDLKVLTDQSFAGLTKITPGIRPLWAAAAGDQKRVMTPREAIDAGAGLLVIGRPITGHEDPVEALRLTVEEIGGE